MPRDLAKFQARTGSLILTDTDADDMILAEEIMEASLIAAIKKLDVAQNPRITSSGLGLISRLVDLEHLDLGRTGFCDADVGCLKTLSQLKTLIVWGTQLTSTGFRQMASYSLPIEELCAGPKVLNNQWIDALTLFAGLKKLLILEENFCKAAQKRYEEKSERRRTRTPLGKVTAPWSPTSSALRLKAALPDTELFINHVRIEQGQ